MTPTTPYGGSRTLWAVQVSKGTVPCTRDSQVALTGKRLSSYFNVSGASLRGLTLLTMAIGSQKRAPVLPFHPPANTQEGPRSQVGSRTFRSFP